MRLSTNRISKRTVFYVNMYFIDIKDIKIEFIVLCMLASSCMNHHGYYHIFEFTLLCYGLIEPFIILLAFIGLSIPFNGFSLYFERSSVIISFKHSISSLFTRSNSKQKNTKCLKLVWLLVMIVYDKNLVYLPCI